MGEITEALRRAKRDRGSRGKTREAYSEDDPRDSAISRAGIDAAPQEGLEARCLPSPAAMDAPKAIPLREVADRGGDVATFSREKIGSWAARAVLLEPNEPHTERFRHFALRVRQELVRRGKKSVLVTSAIRAEGKTFTSCNLALALASMAAEGRIALVELDTRRPTVSRALGITPQIGVEEVLTGTVNLEAARIPTELSSLDLYLVRQPPIQAHEILALPSLQSICRELESRYDFIVVDSPPVLPVPDVSLVLPHVGACVAVVRAGTSRLKNAQEMLSQLAGDKLLGVFVNDSNPRLRTNRYAYYAPEEAAR